MCQASSISLRSGLLHCSWACQEGAGEGGEHVLDSLSSAGVAH